MNTTQLYLLAVMQGVTELFPISSIGHSVVVPALLHWPIDRADTWVVPFLVVFDLGLARTLLR